MATNKKKSIAKNTTVPASAAIQTLSNPAQSSHYMFMQAMNIATDLFARTPFGQALEGSMNKDGSRGVNDALFYGVTTEILEFLKTGMFPSYTSYMQKLIEQKTNTAA